MTRPGACSIIPGKEAYLAENWAGPVPVCRVGKERNLSAPEYRGQERVLEGRHFMRVFDKDKESTADPDFVALLCELSGEDVRKCYQCGKCTAGCPVLEEMDLTPSQVMRAAQAGLRDLVLDSRTIWCCAGCQTCAARCPKGLDLSHVNKALASLAFAEGRTQAARDIAAFHQSFMDTVGLLGRSYELGMIGLLKLRTRKFLQDVAMGMRLFAKGKLGLFPEYVKGNAEVRRLIREALKRTREQARARPGLPQEQGAGGEAAR